MVALTEWVFQLFAFLENMYHECQNAIANFELIEYIELWFVPWQVVYKYCDKSFINKPFNYVLNYVPHLIKKIYCVGTIDFIDQCVQ